MNDTVSNPGPPPSMPEDGRHAQFGTAVGVISLISDVAGLYDLGRKTVTEYRAFDQTSMAYVIRFAREIARIEVWCENMGCRLESDGRLSGPPSATELLRATGHRRKLAAVELRVAEVGALLKDIISAFRAIGNSQLEKVSKFLDDLDRRRPGRDATTGSPDLESGGSTTLRTMEQLAQILGEAGILPAPSTWSERMKKIASRAHPHLERMLSALNQHNTALEVFVDRQRVEALHNTIPAYLSSLDPESIRQGIDGVHDRLSSLQQDISTMFSVYNGARGIDPAVEEAAMLSIVLLRGNLSLASSLRPHGALGLISETNLIFNDDDTAVTLPRQVVTPRPPLSGNAHLMELNVNYEPTGTSQSQERENERVWNRLCTLAKCLGVGLERFRILKAVDAVRITHGSEQRWGILYQLPPGFDPHRHEVVSLQELLPSSPPDCQCDCKVCAACGLRTDKTSVEVPPAPPLGKKFQLAATLVQAFRQFQTSHWLHQSICSHNIIFIRERSAETTNYPDLAEPWIGGFDFARNISDGSDSRTGEPLSMKYQHPLRREAGLHGLDRQRFRAEFDIYAIGRLLLEIAVWEVVDMPALVAEALERLPELVGEGYCEAVRWCLGETADSPMRYESIEGLPPPERGAWPEILVRMFDSRVLGKILRCQV